MGLDGSRPARSGRWASPWPSRAGILALLAILAPAIGPVAGQEEAKPRPPSRPDLTDPVVCLTVEGFRNLVARDEPELTRDEKLQIYYEPFNYVIVRDAGEGGRPGHIYRAHLTQDIRIRRAGSDHVVRSEPSIIDYVPQSRDPPTATYMLTTLSLKEFPPGSYEVDLVLRDELAEGRPEAVRTVPFRVVAATEAPADGR